VKTAGVVVGRVEGVRLDPKSYDAVVTMRIDRQYEFSKDTIAAINTSGLLGEVYIGLDAGGDTVMLKDGDRIGKTQSAVVIEKLISQFLFEKASAADTGNTANAGNAPAAPSKPATKATEGARK
jgi:phospholipid/cholesterol/gamma-HCH transport system substrate-binding protein